MYKMKVVCAWCGKELGYTMVLKPTDGVSHGMCKQCSNNQLEEAKKKCGAS